MRVERTAVVDRVTEQLRSAIMTGYFAGGARLVEADLAQQLGTSRAPVREAMIALQGEGLLTSLPRVGMVVSQFSDQDAWEIFTLRAALEGEAVRLILSNETEVNLDALRGIVIEIQHFDANRGSGSPTELDVRFHEVLVSICGNQRLATSWKRMMSQIALLVRQSELPAMNDLDYMVRRHRSVIEALESGDVSVALAVIDEHIRSVGEEMRQALRSRSRELAPAGTAGGFGAVMT